MTLRSDAVIDYEDELVAVIRHDARNLPLDDGTVDLIVTSPPYFALRSYRDGCETCGGAGTANVNTSAKSRASSTLAGKQYSQVIGERLEADEDCPDCHGTGSGHFDGQIGSEETPDLFLDALDECMVEWGRVLKPSGSLFVNLGDKYAGSTNNRNGLSTSILPDRNEEWRDDAVHTGGFGGVRSKSLVGLPWRFAIRQIDNGWILRAEVVWDKPNGLPESVTDRVRRSHEQWFHMVKEPRYFSGVDEIREPHASDHPSSGGLVAGGYAKGNRNDAEGAPDFKADPLGRLPGSVWRIPSEPLLIPDETREALDLPDHFAAFPQEFPRRIITGWSPTGICTVCGEGRRPNVERELTVTDPTARAAFAAAQQRKSEGAQTGGTAHTTLAGVDREYTITGYACACPTPDAPTTPSVICDPFGGTGTVAGVARTLGRYGISNDLSESYNRLAIWRITQSGHFTKTEQRSWADRQGSLL